MILLVQWVGSTKMHLCLYSCAGGKAVGCRSCHYLRCGLTTLEHEPLIQVSELPVKFSVLPCVLP